MIMKRYIFSSFFFSVLLLGVSQVFAGGISGSIKFSGTAPEPTKLNMDADPFCSGSGADVMSEEVVVNSNQTLRNVFVYVKEGFEGQTFETPADPVILDQKGCRYFPHVFGAQVGQTVQILNSDATLHNVHGMPKASREFNLGMPIKGMKLKRKFDTPEVGIKFKCDVHPWMNAYAGIVAHPFYAVSGDDGSFSIENLPAGSYTLAAWHEKYGEMTQPVTVADGGASKTGRAISRVGFSNQPDQTDRRQTAGKI